MSKSECLDQLKQATDILVEMVEILDGPDPGSPQAFLEAALDAQQCIDRAVLAALIPVLSLRSALPKIEE